MALLVIMLSWSLLNFDGFSDPSCRKARTVEEICFVFLGFSLAFDVVRLGVHFYRIRCRGSVGTVWGWICDTTQAAADSVMFFLLALVTTVSAATDTECMQEQFLTHMGLVIFSVALWSITGLTVIWWIVLIYLGITGMS